MLRLRAAREDARPTVLHPSWILACETPTAFHARLAPQVAARPLPDETSPRVWTGECSHPRRQDQFPETGSKPDNALSSTMCGSLPTAQSSVRDFPRAAE